MSEFVKCEEEFVAYEAGSRTTVYPGDYYRDENTGSVEVVRKADWKETNSDLKKEEEKEKLPKRVIDNKK